MDKNYIKNTPDLTEKEILDMLHDMTVDEKVDQMLLMNDLHAVKEGLISGANPKLYGFAFMPSDIPVDDINFIQQKVLERSRHKIPVLIMGEGLHGVMHSKGTIFPQSIGMACSFNDELMRSVAEVIGKEAHAIGMNQVYAPNLDLAREPRWGRTEETFGEDPYLAGCMGTAYVTGVQSQSVAATLKHYVAHGTPENGLNLSPVHMGERELREIMLEPFARCIAEGNAMSVMPAYSELDGVPVHANKFLLRDILRGELGFDGTVISDYDGITMLTYLHHIARDAQECAKAALNAGIDIEAPTPFSYNDDFRQAIKDKTIDISLIDNAVKNILTIKSRLNLFSHPYVDTGEFDALDDGYAKKLAKQAGDESIVLLKNDNDILPLKKGVKIALVGCNADDAQTGDYSYRNSNLKAISLYEALKTELDERALIYAKGCNISTFDSAELQKAVRAAEQADVVVMALGDNSGFFGGIGWGDASGACAVTCGEGFDVSSLELPPAQYKLFNAVKGTGKPIVVVMYTGRPYVLTDLFARSDAVLQAWYPGEEGGRAVRDVLFGRVCPSGKLSVSFPRSTGHIPCYYNYKNSARGANYKMPGTYEKPGRDYVFDSPDALFPFGYGLSYTKFEYSDLTVKMLNDESVKVSVTVKNTGEYDAKESVLLFLRQDTCPVTPYVKKLRGFKKIFLKKDETSSVEFILSEKDFVYIDEKMRKQLCRTQYTVFVGGLTGTFDLRKE